MSDLVGAQEGDHNGWRTTHWGELVTLEYGRALRDYRAAQGSFRVFGTNGPISWHDRALSLGATVVVGRKGAYRGIHYSPGPCFVIDTAFYIQPKAEIDVRWAYYTLLTQNINGLDSGSAIPSTSRRDFYGLPVSVPPLSEQRAIAHILGTLDDKIELNRRMTTTLEAMARALFKSWFINFDPVRAKMERRDTRLPKHMAALFPLALSESGFATTPRGWTTYRLDEIADHHTNSTSPSVFPDSQFEHYSIPAYDKGQIPAIEPGVSIKSNKIVVPRDAVLLSKLNPENDRVWVTRNPQDPVQVCSTEFLVFTPRKPGNRALLYYLFVDERFRTVMQSMVTGTSKSHQRVPPKALRNSAVVCGTPGVFEMFHQMVGPMLREAIERCAESFTLAAVRDALLPKLVSGEVRATTR